MKITIELDGKEPEVIETNQFFLLTDTKASWNGVDTYLAKMLELYADKIINERRKAINDS